MTSSQRHRQHQHHAAVRSRPRHRQRRRRRADRDRRGDAAAARRHAVAAVVPQEQPGRPADPDAQPDVEHAADVGARRLRRDDDRAAHLDGRTACRRCRCRARRSTRCACRSIPTSCTRSRSASTRSTRRCRTGTSTCRPASCSARTQTYNIKAAGQLMNADAFRPIVVAYRNGAPVRLEQVANVIDSVEDDVQRRRGSTRRTASRRQRAINAAGACASPAPTPSRSPTRSARCCRRSRRSCRRRCTSRPRQDRSRDHPRGVQRHPGARCSSRWCWWSA